MFERLRDLIRQSRYLSAEEVLVGVDDHAMVGLKRLGEAMNQAALRADWHTMRAMRVEISRFLAEYEAVREARDQAFAVVRPQSPSPVITAPSTEQSKDRQAGIYEYKITSAKLAQAHAYLTQPVPNRKGPTEWMVAVSGIKLDDHTYTLEDLVPVAMDWQEAGGAAFDMKAFRPITLTMYDHGLKLHAVFHSHPSRGMPHPSATDIKLQAILESGGYPAIQAVFSQDGYVRFFSNQRKFRITVFGEGVEHAKSGKAFRIREFRHLPSAPTTTRVAKRRAARRAVPDASAGSGQRGNAGSL